MARGAGQGRITREGTSEAVRQAVGGDGQSDWGRLLSVTNAIEAGTCCQGDVAGHRLGALKGGGGVTPFQCIPGPGLHRVMTIFCQEWGVGGPLAVGASPRALAEGVVGVGGGGGGHGSKSVTPRQSHGARPVRLVWSPGDGVGGDHWGPSGALWKGMVGQAREGTSDKTGVGRTKDDGAVTVQRK